MDRRFDLIISKDLLTDKSISVKARLLLAQLLDHRNKKTGQCNPRRKTLAKELGLSMRTLVRALNELRAAQLIRSKQGQHTAFYEIQECQNGTPQAGSGVPNWHSQECQNGTPEPAYPLTEPYQGEYARASAKRSPNAPAPPSEQSPPDLSPQPFVVPRKEAGRELGPYEMYFAAINDSLRKRGRLLTAAEERQVGNLMMLQALKQRQGGGQ